MADQIEFNLTENSIVIKKKGLEKIYFEDSDESYELPKNKNIKIKDYFSNNELIGRKGELKFKELLEKSNIPFLYVGQSPLGIDCSKNLLEDSISKRPDFLINFGHGVSSMLFDVKCYKKTGFDLNGDSSYFYLGINELSKLINLELATKMPVWLAFTDNTKIEGEKVSFSIISISLLNKYYKVLTNCLDGSLSIRLLRVPNELLINCTEKLNIGSAGHFNIDDDFCAKYVKGHLDHYKLMEDKILEIVECNDVKKTNIKEILDVEVGNHNYFDIEYKAYLESMIDSNKLDYEKYKYIKISN